MLQMDPKATALGGATVIDQVALGIGNYTAQKNWIYVLRGASKAQSKHQIKAWQAFQTKVDRLAA